MKMKSIIFVLLTAFLLSACGNAGSGTPTADINQIYTAAAETVIAELTQTAAVTTPTAEVTETSLPTQGAATRVPTSTVPTETPTPTQTTTATATIQPTIFVEASPTGQLCDAAAFVADVSVTDGTEMSPGQSFEKTWLIRNTGTCTWTENYKAVYGYPENLNGQARTIGTTVAPGETVEVTVVFSAPLTAGDYESYWRMANAKGVNFGTFFSVVIVVR